MYWKHNIPVPIMSSDLIPQMTPSHICLASTTPLCLASSHLHTAESPSGPTRLSRWSPLFYYHTHRRLRPSRGTIYAVYSHPAPPSISACLPSPDGICGLGGASRVPSPRDPLSLLCRSVGRRMCERSSQRRDEEQGIVSLSCLQRIIDTQELFR